MHRFLPAIASEFGVTIEKRGTIVRVGAACRSAAFHWTIRVILDLLTVKFLISYSTRPLQIFGLLGFGMGTLGMLICTKFTSRA